jgi:hypothetical protein
MPDDFAFANELQFVVSKLELIVAGIRVHDRRVLIRLTDRGSPAPRNEC